MLRITVPAMELWDEENEKFIQTKEQKLQLEHSLVSLSKWESKWCKAFLSKREKTHEETIDYVKCMTLTQNVDPEVYTRLTPNNIDQINAYIEAPMTATRFSDEDTKSSREVITAEIIYYWMIALQIPLEWEKRHLNRLLTLIKVCNIKNSPPKQRSKKELISHHAALNAARRKQRKTSAK